MASHLLMGGSSAGQRLVAGLAGPPPECGSLWLRQHPTPKVSPRNGRKCHKGPTPTVSMKEEHFLGRCSPVARYFSPKSTLGEEFPRPQPGTKACSPQALPLNCSS